MSVKTFNSLVGTAMNQFAPELTYPTTRQLATSYVGVSGIDASGSLTIILSLTGKFIVEMVYLDGLATTDIDQWKLTIDGVIIHNEDGLSVTATIIPVFGQVDQDNGPQMIIVDKSFLLEIEMASDTFINVFYAIKPIL